MKTIKREWGKDPDFVGPKQKWKNNLIIKTLKNFEVKEKLLEAGFGQGALASQLVQLPVSYSGFDFSNTLVKYTQARLKNITKKKMNIKWGDVRNIPFENNTFECVVSSDILEHVKEENKVIGEYYRVLKKGGLCLITVPLRMGDWTFSDVWAGHFKRYRVPELVSLFKKQGFKNIKVIPYSYSLVRIYYYNIYLPFLKKRIKQVKKTKKYNYNPLKTLVIRTATKILYLLFVIDPIFKNNKPMNALLYATK